MSNQFNNNTCNAILLSELFHTHTNRGQFMSRLGEIMNGSSGINDYIAEMAQNITAMETMIGDDCWDSEYMYQSWEDFCSAFVDEIMRQGIRNAPDVPDIKAILLAVIVEDQELKV